MCFANIPRTTGKQQTGKIKFQYQDQLQHFIFLRTQILFFTRTNFINIKKGLNMAQTSVQSTIRERTCHNVHRTDWRESIMYQLQIRKSVEQNQFEELFSFACGIFERVDIYKSENIQLNLQREQLQQQLLGIQQSLLAGGSTAAKTILSKFPNPDDSSSGSVDSVTKNLSLQHASLIAEKSQLEKKILVLQDNLADALKSKSDTVQKIVDLKTEVDEKDSFIRQSTAALEEKNKEILRLTEKLEKETNKLRTITDEHIALSLSYRSLDTKHKKLLIENDNLKKMILEAKLSDAERLNAENEKILHEQHERMKRELEANVAAMGNVQLNKQPPGDNLTAENFEVVDDDDNLLVSRNAPSRIPTAIEFSFDAHEGETCSVNWYCCNGLRDDYLATGGTDRKLKLWKITNGSSNIVATLLGSNASITSIDVESDAILASSNDYATRIWSLKDDIKRPYMLLGTLTGHSAKVNSAKFLGEPRQVASGSQDRTLKIWDIGRGACLKTYFAGSSCNDLVYNNYQLITGHFDAKIRCWDLKKPNDNESVSQIVMQSKITSLDVSRDGTKLLCSLRDNTIKCLDLRKMEVLQTYSDEKFRIGTDTVRAKFSIDGQLISCGSQDGSLYIWDTATAKVEKILTGHSAVLVASCWSPNGQRIVTIERGRKATIWVGTITTEMKTLA